MYYLCRYQWRKNNPRSWLRNCQLDTYQILAHACTGKHWLCSPSQQSRLSVTVCEHISPETRLVKQQTLDMYMCAHAMHRNKHQIIPNMTTSHHTHFSLYKQSYSEFSQEILCTLRWSAMVTLFHSLPFSFYGFPEHSCNDFVFEN